MLLSFFPSRFFFSRTENLSGRLVHYYYYYYYYYYYCFIIVLVVHQTQNIQMKINKLN